MPRLQLMWSKRLLRRGQERANIKHLAVGAHCDQSVAIPELSEGTGSHKDLAANIQVYGLDSKALHKNTM